MRLLNVRLAAICVLLLCSLTMIASPAGAAVKLTLTVNGGHVVATETGDAVHLEAHATGLNIGDAVIVYADTKGKLTPVARCTVVKVTVNGGCKISYIGHNPGTVDFVAYAFRKGGTRSIKTSPTVTVVFHGAARVATELTLTVSTGSITKNIKTGNIVSQSGVFGPNFEIPTQVAPGTPVQATISANGPLPEDTKLELFEGQNSVCGPTSDNTCSKNLTEISGGSMGVVGKLEFTTGSLDIAIGVANDPICLTPPGGTASTNGGACPLK